MKTNKLMDSIRKSTPVETNNQVDFCVAIANRVFDLMNEKGIKQRDLAKLLGKTETEVSRWLSGTHNLTIAMIAKMAVVLDDDMPSCLGRCGSVCGYSVGNFVTFLCEYCFRIVVDLFAIFYEIIHGMF